MHWRLPMNKRNFQSLFNLALPLVITGLVSACMGFFETVFLARLSHQAMAAGALVSWLFGVFIVIIIGTLSATKVMIAHYHGANSERKITYVTRDALLLCFLIFIPSAYLFWNMAPLFLFFGQKPSLVTLTEPYLHALAWGLLPAFIVCIFTELLMGISHTRELMLFTFISVLFTLVFSIGFIFGKWYMPALGIAGAGWGVTVSYWLIMFLFIFYFFRSQRYRPYFRNVFKFHKPFYIWELIKIGLPMGMMYFVEIGFFFALTLIAGSIDAASLAANQIALQYMTILTTVIFSIAQAITVRMGYLIGAKDNQSAKEINTAGICLSVIFMSFWAIIYWLYPTLLISIDFDPHRAENQQIVVIAKQLLIVGAVFQLIEAVRISLFGALRALKDTNFTLISSIVSFWGIALPLGYGLATYFHFGVVGLWWGMTAGVCLGTLMLWWRFTAKMVDLKP